MKKDNFIKILIPVLFIMLATACQKDPEVGGTAVQDMAGDWHVRVNHAGSYSTLYTFNTSDNVANLMWIQGTGLRSSTGSNIGVKGKVSVDYGSKAFSAEGTTNIAAATAASIPTFSVANGKIIPNGTKGPVSLTPTDSISFDLNINGTIYQVGGYHKTGFLEDLP